VFAQTRRLIRRWRVRLGEDRREPYLRRCRGVIHVGANTGQERAKYARRGLAVLWIEPIPEVAARLRENVAGLPDQIALEALITDRDGIEHVLHVANNDGESSSILPLAGHRDVWPEIDYERSVPLRSITLDTLLAREGIGSARYDVMVVDTQGTELLVLHGATRTLADIEWVNVEVSDFEAYAGGCTEAEVDAFLRASGFRVVRRIEKARHPEKGSHHDLVYRRVRAAGAGGEDLPKDAGG